MTKDDYKLIESEEMYQGRIIKVCRDTIKLPNGKEVYWDMVKHNGAAAVVPVDNDGKIIMVEQYRNSAKKMTLEIPAGGLEKGEDPLVCATRELEEETGNIAKDVEFLFKFYTTIGFCDEVIYVYIAKNLTPTKQNLDEDEFLSIKKFTIDELMEKIFAGEIDDCKTISSLLAYKHKLDKD